MAKQTKLMRKILFLLLFTFSFTALNAQNELKARIEYEEAENAFNDAKFEVAVTRLSKAEQYIGKWTPKISYLKILALDKLCDYNNAENKYTLLQVEEVKPYMNFANQNEDSIDMDKFKTVYAIEEKTKYATKLKEYGLMPDYKNGIEAYKKKDYKTAMSLWEKAAAKGNWMAIDKISDMYRDGVGVEQNYKLSIEWDTKAANEGYLISIADIGNMYIEGEGVPKDYKMGKEKLLYAAESGLDYAMYNMGNLYRFGLGETIDAMTALSWYIKSAEKGYSAAMAAIGALYYYGENGVDKNYNEALVWYKKTAKNGEDSALITIGYLNEVGGYGLTQNYSEAMVWYIKGLEKGNFSCGFRIGRLYENGYGVTKDISQALSYYNSAANNGQTAAMKKLYEIYRNGDGVKRDKKLADEWKAKYEAAEAKE